MRKSKIIDIDYYTIHKDKEGNIFIITKTLDGILLTLKKSVSDGKLQWDKIKRSAKDFTEPYALISGLLFSTALRKTHSKKRESSKCLYRFYLIE